MNWNWQSFAAAGLLGMFVVLAGGAALRESPTVDEVAHIGAGLSYLQRFDLRLNPEHPPLGKMIAAVPLVVRRTRGDYSGPAWKAGESFFGAFLAEWAFGDWVLNRWNDLRSTLMWARAPMLLLSAALGLIIFVYARRIGGPMGAILCLTAYVTAPVFLTFGPLVITDIPVTLFSLIALWQFAETWANPTRRNVLLLALAIAAALLSKFTGAILFVAFAAFALHSRWRPLQEEPADSERRTWRRLRRRAVLVSIFWAVIAVYAFYFIFSWNQPNDAVNRVPTDALRRILMPPWLYVRGLLMMLSMAKRPTFLLGHAYSHGVPFYFPVIFLLKSSSGMLGLLGIAIAAAIGHRKYRTPAVIPDRLRIHWRVLCVSLVVFTVICLLSPMNISLRHFTVPLVLLILLLAPLPRILTALPGTKVLQGATAVFAGLCIVTAVRSYPYYFPYVNVLGMGRPAYTLVNDSNVDWNHGMFEAKQFVRDHGLKQVNLDYLGMTDPAFIIPEAVIWDCQSPKDDDAGKWAILSATMILENHNCGWLVQYPTEPIAGGSLYAVRLPDRIPATGSPGGPPEPSARKLLFGIPGDARAMFVDLTRQPEKIPAAIEAMMRDYEKQQKKNK